MGKMVSFLINNNASKLTKTSKQRISKPLIDFCWNYIHFRQSTKMGPYAERSIKPDYSSFLRNVKLQFRRFVFACLPQLFTDLLTFCLQACQQVQLSATLTTQ